MSKHKVARPSRARHQTALEPTPLTTRRLTRKRLWDGRGLKGAGPASRLTLPLAGILTVAFFAFSPAVTNEFVRWDDYAYIVDNPIIRDLSASSLLHIFDPRTFVLDNYHPLTIISYAIEYHFAGVNPTLYHVDNILLHLCNVALVTYLAWLLTRRRTPTLVAAALFAVHPLRVESVVWAAERKDLLYTFFFLLSLIAYVLYARERLHARRWYAAALACIFLACLAKAQAVVLPLTFLLVDYWFNRSNLGRLILEKIPFFTLSLAFGYWATVAQQTSLTAERLARYSVLDRIAIANYNLLGYFYKLVWPYRLACFYAYPDDLSLVRWAFIPVMCLAVLFYLYARRSKVAVFGVLFFLCTIVIVIQLLPIGGAIIADRFTYVPYLGLFLWAGYGVDRGTSRPGLLRAAVWTIVAAQLSIFAGKTFLQSRTWRDTESLWQQVIKIDPNEPRAHNNLGVIHLGRGEHNLAIRHFEQCVANGLGYDRIDEAYRNLGAAYSSADRHGDAIRAYDLAIRARPGSAETWRNRGLACARAGDQEEAVASFSKALELDPKDANAQYSRGNAFRRMRRFPEAIADYSRAVALAPDHATAYSNRGNCFVDVGQLDQAIDDYDTAIRLAPDEGLHYLNRSKAYYRLGELEKAGADYDESARRGYSDESFLEMLSRAREGKR